MEEQIQDQVSLLIGKYGWLFIVGVLTLLFRSTIEKLVAGMIVFMGNDYNEDDVVEVDGKPGRIVRCGIWSTTFFVVKFFFKKPLYDFFYHFFPFKIS